MKTSSWSWPVFLVLGLAFEQADAGEPPQGGPADAEEAILAVIAQAASDYESASCDERKRPWFPDQPPFVSFAAESRVMSMATMQEVVAYCQRMKQGRVSASEEIKEQAVHVLTPDVAYVVTQGVQKSEWQDGRTSAQPTVETAIVMRQGGEWRIVYKHLSW